MHACAIASLHAPSCFCVKRMPLTCCTEHMCKCGQSPTSTPSSALFSDCVMRMLQCHDPILMHYTQCRHTCCPGTGRTTPKLRKSSKKVICMLHNCSMQKVPCSVDYNKHIIKSTVSEDCFSYSSGSQSFPTHQP